MTRANLRNAASTLAHHWASGEGGSCAHNRLGVERCLLAYPEGHQRVLCAMMFQVLNTRHGAHHADAFEDMLYDAAMIGGAS
jgi:hypothetical protein